MQLADIRIDDATWDTASPERRREWRVVLDELIAEHRFVTTITEPVRLLVNVRAEALVWDAHSIARQTSVARCEVEIGAIESHLSEYFQICEEMGKLVESATSPRVEALDIAKRLVHDEAAETLRVKCHAFGPDHATARRLFTLIVTLRFDTTTLVRPHHLDATLERRRMRELLGK